jgi:hypothetical protein
MVPGAVFTTMHFICNLQMGLNKLERFYLASLPSLMLFYNLAYWTHF